MIKLGTRRLLAATCFGCGILKPGNAFAYHHRNLRDKHAYIDHRCSECKWGTRSKARR